MWDFKIGEGDSGASSTNIARYRGVSENGVSYWITTGIGLSFVVMKDSEEGKCIKKWIEDRINPYVVDEYLNEMALRHIPISYFLKWYEDVKNKCYKSGEEDAKDEIRRSLGL